MNRDDIIRLAKEAGAFFDGDNSVYDMPEHCFERFANLVAAAEREACAKVVGRYFTTARFDSRHLGLGDVRLTIGDQEEIAAAIRARGET